METLLSWLDQGEWPGLLLEGGGMVLLAIASYLLGRHVLIRLVEALFSRTKNKWDDVLIKHRVVHGAVNLIPAVVLFYGVEAFPAITEAGQKIVYLYILVNLVLIVSRILDSLLAIYQTFDISRKRPLKGYFQLVKMFVFIVGAIFIFSLVLDRSPWGLLSGLGAMTAVLMLIFKDTILSFVASIQIAGNDLLHRGDWIEMPAFGADGDVVDVALHTVKVQNFDKTIVSIPTFKFLDNSFKNWRGMSESGGRRIKRSLLIDQSSIRFCSPGLLEELEKIDLLRPHIERKKKEIEEHNKRNGISSDSPVNGRRLTNIGLFRAYVLAYLENHPKVHKNGMTLLVRQLQPEADSGLPLQIYCFTTDTAWGAYEGVQSDIFDHVLAALPEFGLRAYQRNALKDERGEGVAG